jgi:hypothetical protein
MEKIEEGNRPNVWRGGEKLIAMCVLPLLLCCSVQSET